MTREQDYYAILQVDRRAEREVIEAAYRRLAAKYHPDVDHSAGATGRMKQLNAAYEVLSDPQKRAAYDLRRRLSPFGQPSPGPGPSAPPQTRTQWFTSAAVTAIMLLLTFGGARFGPKTLILVGLLVLLGLLIVAYRKS